MGGQSYGGGLSDIVIAKYDTSGTQSWVRQIGTSGSDVGNGIAFNSTGVYVTGQTGGALTGSNQGSNDVFIAKYNSSGTQSWIRQIGTSGNDIGYGIAVDSSGNSYVAGFTGGALDGQPNAGGDDVFVAKYDTSGTKQAVNLLGTSGEEFGTGVGVDTSGNAYVTGFTDGNLGGETNNGGTSDLFIWKRAVSATTPTSTGTPTNTATPTPTNTPPLISVLTWASQTSGTTNSLWGVAFGNSTFVAVGIGGTILTSPNGTNWTQSASPVDSTLYGVTFGNGTFVAVGNSGTIRTSPDGTNWTSRTSGVTNTLSGVAFGNSTFVAVGQFGTILTSTNGETWTPKDSITNNHLWGVTFGNNTFVAVGNSGTILTSTNGSTWISRTSGTTESLWGVAFGNNTFVAVAGSVSSGGKILTSNNGETWVKQTITTPWLLSVGFGNNTFVAVGNSGTILTSPDGTTWTSQTSGITTPLWGVAFGNNTFVAVGDGGTILTGTLTSATATPTATPTPTLTPKFSVLPDWVSRTSGTKSYLRVVAFGNSTFVAVGIGTSGGRRVTGGVLTSTDGITWTDRTPSDFTFVLAVAFGNGTFVAVGVSGGVLTSTDGITWTSTNTGTTTLQSVAFGNGTFVAVGLSGTIAISTDNGANWTVKSSGTNLDLKSVAFGNNTFVALTTSRTTSYSTNNGVSWTTGTLTGSIKSVYGAVAFGNGKFLTIVEDDNRGTQSWSVLTSTNGITWSDTGSFGPNVNSLWFGNGTFIALTGGALRTSTNDGITWTLETTSANPLKSVTYGNNTFVAVGDKGTILTKRPNWNVIQAIPTVGAGTPTPFATIAIDSGNLSGTSIGVPAGEMTGATITLAEVENVPQSLAGGKPAKVLALRISDVSGCVSGITVSVPATGGGKSEVLVIWINNKWIEVPTTLSSDGKTLTGKITCAQLTSARASDKSRFGFGRDQSDIVIFGLAEQSLVVPSLGRIGLVLLLITLTGLIIHTRRRADGTEQ